MIVPEQDAPSAACRLRRQRNLLLLRASVVSVSLGLVLLLFLNLSLWLSPPSPQPHDFYGKTSPECFEPPKIPGDRRRDKEHLKIANFNAEWLFLYGGRGGMRCPAESCPWSNTVNALNHLKNVAKMIAEVDADVVHLSEVEDCRVLRSVLAAISGDHGYEPYLVMGKDHATGQNVGLLTRVDPVRKLARTEKRAQYPVPESACKSRASGTIGVTKHYVASIDVDDGHGKTTPFLFTGLHFLAMPLDKSRCPQREGQATVIRNMVQSMSMGAERIVIMGDFNDYDREAVGPDKRLPISSALKILYGSSGSGRRLLNAASLVPQENRYSCWFDANQNCIVDGDNERSMIDHILLDASLTVVEAIMYHESVPTCESRISDHWPFSVKIKL